MDKHLTVLRDEAVAALIGDAQGCYVDGTFGRGGHSRLILQQLGEQGRLLGVDKDARAIESGHVLSAEDGRFSIVRGSFADIDQFVEQAGWNDGVDGVLLDLGVSSPQLDQAERGFSFLRDGELDMRMDADSGISAADWLAVADEADIARVLKEYGEERFAKRISRAIVAARDVQPIRRTLQLAKIVAEANPAWEKHKHPATRAFQAIRIFINNELGDLESFLEKVVAQLRPGGRLVVISFHSLEDRMVKRFMRKQAQGERVPSYLPVRDEQLGRSMRLLGKAVKASDDEVAANPRARSAVMRVAEKLGAEHG